jgi:hypothetical protein
MCRSKRGPQAPTEKAKEAARLNTPHNVHMHEPRQTKKEKWRTREGKARAILVLFGSFSLGFGCLSPFLLPFPGPCLAYLLFCQKMVNKFKVSTP